MIAPYICECYIAGSGSTPRHCAHCVCGAVRTSLKYPTLVICGNAPSMQHIQQYSQDWIGTNRRESGADVVCIKEDANVGGPDATQLASLLAEYKDRDTKIGTFAVASNLTGICLSEERMAGE